MARACSSKSAAAMKTATPPCSASSLDVLTAGIPEPMRGKLRKALLDRIEEAHRKAGTTAPKWLAELRGSD
jgi:hypothetical protein